jgi:16S rRNA (adenine1518-N6/adenine1519-N6)-dimethyltransferase
MTLPNYDSPAQLRAFLAERNLIPQRQFGQNFLVSPAARNRILAALDLERGTPVWEVGPGLGAMTEGLLRRGADVTAFELDHAYAALLRQFFGADPCFHLVEGDVLKTWEPALRAAPRPERFFGNLPYNIAANLVASTITAGVLFPQVLVTVQKEVAARICAAPGSKDYSALSVLCGRCYRAAALFDLSPGNFWPRPRVASTVVSLTPREDAAGDIPAFAALLHRAFASRRKTLHNNLAAAYGPEQAAQALTTTHIAGHRRAETLTPEEFRALASLL